jgi:hypothetical protein
MPRTGNIVPQNGMTIPNLELDCMLPDNPRYLNADLELVSTIKGGFASMPAATQNLRG